MVEQPLACPSRIPTTVFAGSRFADPDRLRLVLRADRGAQNLGTMNDVLAENSSKPTHSSTRTSALRHRRLSRVSFSIIIVSRVYIAFIYGEPPLTDKCSGRARLNIRHLDDPPITPYFGDREHLLSWTASPTFPRVSNGRCVISSDTEDRTVLVHSSFVIPTAISSFFQVEGGSQIDSAHPAIVPQIHIKRGCWRDIRLVTRRLQVTPVYSTYFLSRCNGERWFAIRRAGGE